MSATRTVCASTKTVKIPQGWLKEIQELPLSRCNMKKSVSAQTLEAIKAMNKRGVPKNVMVKFLKDHDEPMGYDRLTDIINSFKK